MISIAIDGPSGAGKSTISRTVAEKLGYLYVDTGALYRTIGLYVLRKGGDPKNEQQVEALLPELKVDMGYENGIQQMFLQGENVTGQIRTPQVSMAASGVSAHSCVRAYLLELQRRLARENNVIMDGRDIGTVVLPKADVKIFLTASSEVRAKRRFDELTAKGENTTFEKVLEDVEKRDYADIHRAISPLVQAEDAIVADTSQLNFEESVALIQKIITEHLSTQNV
ncbi:MAG TPA: (d)CMP kinase [Candidatus Faecivivens stercoripullorum]|uniref:Cytidylate kinase n=1 Tax=Candidatus Faecivivens stercoripullorum TaxID=2840805 RepID=A0A9D1KSQ0_9FIRM|nr:(d)CMP kinase [Candidatus Faecivivens stercoripullorum]